MPELPARPHPEVAAFVEWLESQSAAELAAYEAWLQESAFEDEAPREAAAAIPLVRAVRVAAELREEFIRPGLDAAWPELDADVFCVALSAILRARRQLGADIDPLEVLDAALEITRRREATE